MGTFNASPLTTPPAVIINRYSSGGVNTAGGLNNKTTFKHILSGVLVANTFKEILSLTGSGVISIALAYQDDTTARFVGLRVIFDGQATPAFSAVNAGSGTAGRGLIAIGIFDDASAEVTPESGMVFNQSLSLWVSSDLNETDKIGLGVLYRTT